VNLKGWQLTTRSKPKGGSSAWRLINFIHSEIMGRRFGPSVQQIPTLRKRQVFSNVISTHYTDCLIYSQGELEHRRVKRFYGRTNKNRAVKQMTKHERRETRLLRARRAAQAGTHAHHVAFSDNDPLPYTHPAMHHHISESKRHSQDAFSFCRKFPDDPAATVSMMPGVLIVLTNLLLPIGLCPSIKRPSSCTPTMQTL
jgi:hypothetical protein